ncbi:hypothetical protein KP509_39G040700 [Ceratopteris richardii]|uniref:Uncharacterized protein n=1 Tax=Ceratopteris richardii TaxID=49495 RepID=A0A8T2Q070_CERRI|nr:hypothetical protein KP509_39G040700 [Ceratopteris richardii]
MLVPYHLHWIRKKAPSYEKYLGVVDNAGALSEPMT